jgi:hypothetical protein
MTRDSMDDDEKFVLPVNFPVVGCILLEFTNALCEHMVRQSTVYDTFWVVNLLLPAGWPQPIASVKMNEKGME